jgi:hypothetical protein
MKTKLVKIYKDQIIEYASRVKYALLLKADVLFANSKIIKFDDQSITLITISIIVENTNSYLITSHITLNDNLDITYTKNLFAISESDRNSIIDQINILNY